MTQPSTDKKRLDHAIDLRALDAFLVSQKLDPQKLEWIKGDASFRRYGRIEDHGNRWIVMMTPPSYDSIEPFIQIAQYLSAHDIHAPRIHAHDLNTGFALLEDFGATSLSTNLNAHPNQAIAHYQLTLDVLLKMQSAPVASWLRPYDEAFLWQEASLLSEWFLPEYYSATDAARLAQEYEALIRPSFSSLTLQKPVFVHRDYHVENIMVIEGKIGIDSYGILDFQDGLAGNPAYDLVSILQDARRDVSAELERQLMQYYLEKSSYDHEDFQNDYYTLGIQRNCKILGIFVRLAVRDNKPHYLPLLPRVYQYIARSASHAPAHLQPLLRWMNAVIQPVLHSSDAP